MEFCHQSWNFTNFAPKLYEICSSFATTEKLSICVESLHFPVFSAKCREYKIEKRDGHVKLRKCDGKVIEKSFVKSVGTLLLHAFLF